MSPENYRRCYSSNEETIRHTHCMISTKWLLRKTFNALDGNKTHSTLQLLSLEHLDGAIMEPRLPPRGRTIPTNSIVIIVQARACLFKPAQLLQPKDLNYTVSNPSVCTVKQVHERRSSFTKKVSEDLHFSF